MPVAASCWTSVFNRVPEIGVSPSDHALLAALVDHNQVRRKATPEKQLLLNGQQLMTRNETYIGFQEYTKKIATNTWKKATGMPRSQNTPLETEQDEKTSVHIPWRKVRTKLLRQKRNKHHGTETNSSLRKTVHQNMYFYENTTCDT